MRINESRVRMIIREEARRILGTAAVLESKDRHFGVGNDERASTGSNLDWLIGFVGAYPGELTMADLRRALKSHRGIYRSGPETRGHYSSMFAEPDRIRKYVDVGTDGTLTLNAAGEDRLDMMSYPQSAPGQEELQDAYARDYDRIMMDRDEGLTRPRR